MQIYFIKMPAMDISLLMKEQGLKTTQPRVQILNTLQNAGEPLSPQEVQSRLGKQGINFNIATIYRVLASLYEVHLVHRYPCSGGYSACQIPGEHGHHVLAHCHSCGTIKEFVEPKLCKLESAVADKAGLTSTTHFSEICGLCNDCSK